MKKPITKDMIDTLLGLKKGRSYILRGDRTVGLEVNRDAKSKNNIQKNCRSLAPLMRRGFVEFESSASDMSRFYRVRITEWGEEKLRRTSE